MEDAERNQAQTIQDYVNDASKLSGVFLNMLIVNATINPKLFAFSEILAVPAVAQLEGTEHSKYVDLLRLFAYGTWSDYKSKLTDNAVELELPQQVPKLKQLTVLSVAEDYKVIPYDVLMQAIDVPSVRQLEDFLIDECITVGIVKGKLNPLQGCFEVEYAAARDPKPGQLENMIEKLSGWLSTSDEMLLAIQENIKLAEEMSKLNIEQGREFEDTKNEIEIEIKKRVKITRVKRKRSQSH